MKPSKNWWRKAEIYKIFARGNYDFSEKAALELFLYESKGIGSIEVDRFSENGYAIGKKWCDWQVNFWLDSTINGQFNPAYLHLTIRELYEEGEFPHWWLDKIFKDVFDKRTELTLEPKKKPPEYLKMFSQKDVEDIKCPIKVN